MPSSQRRVPRRRYTKRKKISTKSRTYKTAVVAAKRVLNKQAETKYDWTYFTPSSYPYNAGSFQQIYFAVNQGTGDSGYRIGDKITLKNISLKIYTQFQDGGTYSPPNTSYQRVRMIIFEWNQQGTTPSFGDVFNHTTHSSVMFSHYNHDNIHAGRIRILHDKQWQVYNPAKDIGPCNHLLNMNIRKLRKTQQFEGSGGSSTLLHPIYIALFTDTDATYSDFYPDVQIEWLVNYTDV